MSRKINYKKLKKVEVCSQNLYWRNHMADRYQAQPGCELTQAAVPTYDYRKGE